MTEQELEQVPLMYLFDKHPAHYKILLKPTNILKVTRKNVLPFLGSVQEY